MLKPAFDWVKPAFDWVKPAFDWVKPAFDWVKAAFDWVGRVRLGEGRVRLAGGGVRLDDHEVPGIYIRDLYCLCDITRLSTYALPPLQREMPESFDIVLLCKITKKREKRIAKAENKEKKPKAAS